MKRAGQRPADHRPLDLRGVTVLRLDESRWDPGVAVHLPPLPRRAQVDVRIALAPGVRRLHSDVARELADWLRGGAARVQVEGEDPSDVIADLEAAFRGESDVEETLPYLDPYGMTDDEREAFARRYVSRASA